MKDTVVIFAIIGVFSCCYAFVRLIFNAITPREIKYFVEPEQIWVSVRNGDDPFPRKFGHKVKVISVLDGWVRYMFVDSFLWQDERKKISTFVEIYKLEEK